VRITSLIATGAMVALLSGCVSSCSSGDSSLSDDVAPSTVPPRVSPLGPFFGECGSVGDAELTATVAVPQFATVFRNSVGCVWETGALGPIMSFSWYRGSPIGREMAGSGLIGRPPEQIQVQGHAGFRGELHGDGGDICEISVQFGDDFFEWSVSYGDQQPATDSCAAAMKLADLTISRTK